MSSKVITKNKKAFFDYEIVKKYEAGVSLYGYEVKSIRNGGINIQNSYVKEENGDLYLWNADISKYRYADIPDYDPMRRRRLLLKRREISEIILKSTEARLTVVPLYIKLVRGKVKVDIGLVRGKKQHEKKEKIKERDLKRELHREKRRLMVK